MSKQISSLSVGLFATVQPFANGLKAGEKAIGGFIGKVEAAGFKMLELTGIAGLVGGAIGGAFALGSGFQLAGQLEAAKVQLTAMTGSANNATIILGQLRDFAKSSPFEFPELLEASKKLLGVGVSADQIMPLLKETGEVAAGTGSDIAGVADIFVKVAAEGKVSARELREFGNQGIPVVQTLAKQFNTTAEGVAALADNGTIGFKQLQDAFDSMTSKGGAFNGILAAQSKTIGGVFHTMADTAQDAAAGVAESLLTAFNVTAWLPKFTSAISGIGTVIQQGIGVAAPYIIGFATSAVHAFESVYNFAKPPIMKLLGVVETVWGGMLNVATTYGGAVLAAAVGAFNQVVDFARPIWEELSGAIASNWGRMFESSVQYGVALTDFVGSAFNGILEIGYDIWGGLTGAWAWGWNLITGQSTTGADSVKTCFDTVVTAVTWLQSAATNALGFASYSIQNFGTLVKLIGTGVAFDFVRMGNQISWVFTGIVWPALQWAGSQIWDWTKWTGNVFANLGSNIVGVFGNLPGLISGSVKFGDVWKPLTEGFKSTAATWPGIAQREVGPLEQALQGQYEDLSNKFGEGLGNHLAKNAEKASQIVKTAMGGGTGTSWVNSLVSGIDSAGSAISKVFGGIFESTKKPLTFDTTLNPKNQTLGITPEIHRAKALMSGGADSLAARFNSPTFASGGGALGPLAASPAVQPPTATVPGISQATSSVAAAAAKSQQDQLQVANQWLYRIEQNTRGSGNGMPIVSIAA